MEDIKRDAKTGLMPENNDASAALTHENVHAVAAGVADDSADDDNDPEEASVNSCSDDEEGGSSTEELDGEDYAADAPIHEELPENYPHCIIGKTIYHRYDDGWYPGKVLREISLSSITSRNGKFACKIEDSVNEIDHQLKSDDYGRTGHWVLAK